MNAGLTNPEPAASQREFDQLRQRLDTMDVHGTRGVGVIQVQVTELVKDLAELRISTAARADAHERQHVQDVHDHRNQLRWLTGTAIAAVVALAAILTLVIDIASHVK